MCLDETVLAARAKGLVPNTLRFLQFRPHCALVGFHQSVDLELRRSFCREQGIDINRRITGGGAIYFGEDTLGWEVIASKDTASRDVLAFYRRLCRAAIEGLRLLGVDASFRPVNDIEVQGRKISGTGGTEMGRAFLFQGTLLVDLDLPTMLRALRIPAEKLKDKEIAKLKERMTCLRWELGERLPMVVIKEAMVAGFARTFGAEFVPGGLTPWEQSCFDERLPEFQSAPWIDKVRRPRQDDSVLYAVYKAPGGLIRISIRVDDVRDRIKMVLITGDFFAYPRRAILDLEARLKSCPIAKMAATVRSFFEETDPIIPGVTAEDFIQAIEEALAKRDLRHLGLSTEEANQVHLINDAMVRLPEAGVLLLPYCAKLATCELRYDKDCISCGECNVGVAYELARRHNLEPITIVDFEDLQRTLVDMKQRGVSCFLGCCCDPFFVKHREDFEKAGMGGLLMNIENTTCYDLNQESLAKQGKFGGETKLNLSVLEKVICNRI
jgi:lipoate-protein ligase A